MKTEKSKKSSGLTQSQRCTLFATIREAAREQGEQPEAYRKRIMAEELGVEHLSQVSATTGFDALMARICRDAGDDAFLLSQMIEAAFKVDRLGFLPHTEVTKLLSYKVNDASWNAGADILRQAQTTERGKRYLSIEQRSSLQPDFRPIRLDISDCWPEGGEAR